MASRTAPRKRWKQVKCEACSGTGITWSYRTEGPVDCGHCCMGYYFISEGDAAACCPGGPFVGKEPGRFAELDAAGIPDYEYRNLVDEEEDQPVSNSRS